MARVPRSSDSPAPKKRTPKAKPEAEVTTKVVKAVSKPAAIEETVAAPNLEEKVRVRAYELYLQRNGHGGSPEQDWLQAVAEVYGQVGA